MLRKKNKKGDISDIFVFLIILFFLAISFIVGIFVNDKILDVITDTKLNESSASLTIISAFETMNSYTIQRAYVLIAGLLMIGMLVSAFLIRIHPAFIFIYIISLAFAILISVYLGNMYSELVETDVLSEIATSQPMITYFMQHIVIILLSVGALSMIIIFSKIFSQPGRVDI